MQKYVIGLDFGTDEACALIVNAFTGETLATSVKKFTRWEKKLYCNPTENQWRHHPLDYLEAMEYTIKDALSQCSDSVASNVVGIAFDTTGSTPALVDESGTPLALLPEFEENPDAMFILWKDHTAVTEADEINQLCKKWSVDFSKYEGGVYSAEWFWAKAMHVMREDDSVASKAYAIVELCEWLPAVLTGVKKAERIVRSRCAYGHKAMWSPEWDGLPSEEFLVSLEPKLSGLRFHMSEKSYTADIPVGHLCLEWAERLGLSTEVRIAGGAYDCHMGAVGAGVTPNSLVRVIGPSTCDVMVASPQEIGNRCIKGICGQVDGSVIPGMIGLEAGQSSFGDVFDTFRRLLEFPVMTVLRDVLGDKLSKEDSNQYYKKTMEKMFSILVEEAQKLPLSDYSIIATDWINGRRTPDANQMLKGSIIGLSLDTSAAKVLRSLVEATAYGTRAIVERFESEGIKIDDVIGIGEIALRSPFVMQTMCDVINKPIRICNTDHACALGAAMFAATAAGVYEKVEDAISAMNSGFKKEYNPIKENVEVYSRLYLKYQKLGQFTEQSNIFASSVN